MSEVLLRVSGSGEPIAVGVERPAVSAQDEVRVTLADRAVDVEVIELSEQGGLIRAHGRVHPFYTLRDGGSVHVWMHGRTHVLEIVERTARRATEGGGAAAAVQTALTAPMPGTILKINIAPGDRFEAHQPLIVMESMKMEMTLSAPHPGRVKDILCRTGQLVEMNALLARFEDSGA